MPFIRYYEAKLKAHMDDMGYRIYVTDCLQTAPQNKYITVRYADLIKKQEVDNRSGDEIAAQVINELGLRT